MRALLQVADTGPLDSLRHMLERVGIDCYVPGPRLRRELSTLGGLVLGNEDLQRSMGYEAPQPITEVESMEGMDFCFDVKAHQILKKWKYLAKLVWYRINGGQPEHVPGHGDEVNSGVPIVTPNQWYKGDPNAYAFWPYFVGWERYGERVTDRYDHPVCLIHNIGGWGYQDLVPHMRALGVRCYGRGSPDGLVNHSAVPDLLRRALCSVHLKSNDAPGYAIYESLATGCPVVCTRRLIWRCKMQELLIPGKTCLVFDRETHEGLTPDDIVECTRVVDLALTALRDPEYNRQIGEAGREQLQKVMWRDVDGFADFMRRIR